MWKTISNKKVIEETQSGSSFILNHRITFSFTNMENQICTECHKSLKIGEIVYICICTPLAGLCEKCKVNHESYKQGDVF
jgi:hypothetical protein